MYRTRSFSDVTCEENIDIIDISIFPRTKPFLKLKKLHVVLEKTYELFCKGSAEGKLTKRHMHG